MVTLDDIRRTREAIAPHVVRTPLLRSESLSQLTGADVWLKCENLQRTGSFKVRGAFNKLLGIEAERVIAASMGNHAQGVAYAATTLGLRSRIVMPQGASVAKQVAVRAYGGEVVLHGECFVDALDYAQAQEGWTFVHTFDDERLIEGQGTLALEFLEELDDIDAVISPVGGGSLISGIAIAVKAISPDTRVLGIQSEAATSAYRSFREGGGVVEVDTVPSLADGISVGRVGERTLEVMRQYVDDMGLVDDGAIARAVLLFLERKRLVVEGAGAVPLAYLLEHPEPFRGRRVVLITSGGNIDFTAIDRIIHRGLVASGRIGHLEVVLQDVPGALGRVTGVIAGGGASIVRLEHDRFPEDVPYGMTRVRFTVEVTGQEHLEELVTRLNAEGLEVRQ